jgi:hypothetical protein
MALRKVADREETVRLLGESDASGLGRAEWARRHGIDLRRIERW